MFRKFLELKIWQLSLISIALFASSVFFLRSNSLNMQDLYLAVIEADKQGDQELVEKRLNELRGYVFSHMNTTVDSLPLQTSYDKAFQKAQKQVQASTNSKLYDQAQKACVRPGSSRTLVQDVNCVTDYINARSKDRNSKVFRPPNPEEYTYSFESPIISNDPAGWSLVLATFFAGAAIVRYLVKEELLLFPNIKERLLK